MIFINNKEKLKNIELYSNNFYVVIDFDKTITKGDSTSTWGTIASLKDINKDYAKKRIALYEYYRPIEIDSSIADDKKISIMSQWFDDHMRLLYKYKLKEETLNRASIEGGLKYRNGIKEFLKNMYKLDIPVIIISAGIGNIIEKFLKDNNDYYPNIKIVSNFFEFKNGEFTGLKGTIIHSHNKNIVNLDKKTKELINTKKNILLIGDGLADLKMISEEDIKRAITVGFLDEKIEENLDYYNKEFDIVITDNGSFDDINKILNIYN